MRLFHRTLCLFLLSSTFFALLSLAATPPNKPTPSRIYTWHDGSEIRKVRMLPGLVAEFGGESPLRSRLKEEVAGAKLQSSPSHRVRIWKIPSDEVQPTVRRLTSPPTLSESYSPVFRDTTLGAGRLRALPGNVLVTLNSHWTKNQVDAWINRHNLSVVKILSGMPNVILVYTPPGMESLQLANKLYQSGEVEGASPDWWLEHVIR